MTAADLVDLIVQLLFLVVFAATLANALRFPRAANVHTALLFGAVALIVVEGWALELFHQSPSAPVRELNGAAFMTIPYLLLRLVDDFAGVPWPLMRVADAGLILGTIGFVALPQPLPAAPTIAYIVYFVVLTTYAALRFIRQARASSGVTRRRMEAVAVGSICLGLLLVAAGVQLTVPAVGDAASLLSRLLGVASALAYYIGFAPPNIVRRAWQEPELRRFLGRAAQLPRLPDTAAIVRQIEGGAASSLGAHSAAVGLYEPENDVLRFEVADGTHHVKPGEMTTGRAFAEQRAIFAPHASRDNPDQGELYRTYGSGAVMAAPITAGEKRLGVLVVYAPKPPVFGEEDLRVLQLLADQAAVVLESRALIDEAARVQAREEATRLKDDFLSAAAHDLRSPLTTLVAGAQLLARRAEQFPERPADPAAIRRVLSEAQRLRALVLELLDASRAERGSLVGELHEVDLAEVARRACARLGTERHPCIVDAPEPVVGDFDAPRIEQLVTNLVENAVKYSPEGGAVRVAVWRDGAEAHLAVEDQGIGIPPEDVPRVFDRFHRAANVDDRSFAGMGLGLFICRAIAEGHGGRISAASELGRGSRFEAVLPCALPQAAERAAGAQPSLETP